MNWPQYVVLIWIAVESVYVVAKHGQPIGAHNGAITLICHALLIALLYAGGFFKGVA